MDIPAYEISAADDFGANAIGEKPREYTEELGLIICERLMDGMSRHAIVKQQDMPTLGTLLRWLAEQENFSRIYAQARAERNHSIFEETLDIANDGSNDWMEIFDKNGDAIGWRVNGEAIQRSKLRVDQRKWFLAKLDPVNYGEKTTTELSGPNGGPIQTKATIELNPAEAYLQMINGGKT